jgi:tetratricopeptide (TPR) repeat protein
MTASVRWIESTCWELAFYGLPNRIPWPEDADPASAQIAPLNLEALLEAIDRLGNDISEPWLGFQSATGLFQELSESLEGGELIRSHRLLDEIERLHSGSPFVQFQKGNLARLEGEEEKAFSIFQSLVEKFPGIPPAWSSLGAIQAQKGEREAAVRSFRKALEMNGNDQLALEGLTRLRELVRLMRQDEDGKPNPKAVGYVDTATFTQMVLGQIDSLAAEPEQLLALADQLMRDGIVLEVATTALEKANEVRPNHGRTLLSLATAYRAANRHEHALEKVREFTKVEANEATGFMHLAQACHTLGRHEEEREALAKVLELDCNFHAAIGVYFELSNGEHDPAKEETVAKWSSEHNSWMGHLIASSIARARGDNSTALRHADNAFAINPDSEEVLLHLSAVLGDQRELNRLATQIRPAVESRRYSARLDWNYSQTLHQLGLRDEAAGVLRRALSEKNAPDEFKSMAIPTLEAWGGVLTGCGLPIELNQGSNVTRPILITLEDGDGGIVIGAGRQLPVEGTFPLRHKGTATIDVQLQQGESGGATPPRDLGIFRAGGVDTSENAKSIECNFAITPQGVLHFRAAQNGQRLPVGWVAPK